MTTNLHEHLLTPSGQAKIREYFKRKSPFVLHSSPAAFLPSIRETGLQLNNELASKIPEELHELLDPYQEYLCFSPQHFLYRSLEHHKAPYVRYAVKVSDIDSKFLIDWSFGGAWEKSSRLFRDNECDLEKTLDQYFSIFKSIVVVNQINPKLIKIQCNKCDLSNPERWPSILNVPNLTDIYLFGSREVPLPSSDPFAGSF